jgi:hypothetical protein
MTFISSRSVVGILMANCIAGPQLEMRSADNRSIDDRFIRSGTAGREIRVRGYMRWDRDCSSKGDPAVLLDESPRRGVACLQIRKMRAARGFLGRRRVALDG